MQLDNACVACIKNQGERVAQAQHVTPEVLEVMRKHVAAHPFDFSLTPPQIAATLYASLANIAQVDDLYAKEKADSTRMAKTFIPQLQQAIDESRQPFYTALLACVAGNVIDLASQAHFNLDEEIATLFAKSFFHDDSHHLNQSLQQAKTLLIIGDNVGEHLFDKLFMQYIAKAFPDLTIYYMVRGTIIINDVTMKEAIEDGLDQVATLVDSGVDTPGFDYDRATPNAQALFDSADVVMTKGMGNYESLNRSKRTIFFVLKVKCSVVASSVNAPLGSLLCLRSSLS